MKIKFEFKFLEGIILIPTIYVDFNHIEIGFLNMGISFTRSKE